MTAPATREVELGDRFLERVADDLKVGDGVLCRNHDAAGMLVEEVWFVAEARTRRYGQGSRILVTWSNGATDSYQSRVRRFGVLVAEEVASGECSTCGLVSATTDELDRHIRAEHDRAPRPVLDAAAGHLGCCPDVVDGHDDATCSCRGIDGLPR
jgi:hypothetical protein